MNTLDSILPELRSLLPASLRGAYLDGYLQRRRTPMELLLSRSLPNVDVAASTFEDVRSEIRSLGLPLWVANQYLAEAEQALAVGHDTREVVAAAKAWLATKLENPPSDDAGCHVCSETGKKSCTACGTELTHMGAHGEGCPKCSEQEMDALDAQASTNLRQTSRHEPPPIPPEGPQTPLREQDPHSVDILDRLVAALSEVFIVTPIRGGHGYRVVDLRSKSTDGVFTGLPRNTYLTTVSLWNSKKPDFLGEKAYLVQSFRDAGRSQDQYRALRRSMVETVERLSDEAQGNDSPAAAAPAPPPLTTRERYRREILSLGLSFDRENEAMSALDRALINGHDPEEVMRWARRPEPAAEEPRAPRPAPSQPADPAKIADRVRKLLALAERAGTPEEAGTAYAQAQKLIAQHAISEEQLRQSRLGASTRSNEPIVSRIIYTSPVPQMPTWIGVLGMCLSETNGCEMAQSHGPNREVVLKAWGRASDLEIVEELLRVIPGQVDALCNRSSFSGRTAKNNFRIGAVTVICERMRAAVREARRAIQEDTSEHSVATTALALASLDNRGALAKAQMRRDVPNLRMKSTSHRGDAASFEAGRAAGASIGLSRQRSIK